MKYKEVIVVEIGRNLIKLAKTYFSGKKIKDFSLEVIGQSSQESFLRVERILSQYSGLSKKRKIIISFPRNLFVTRYIELPSEDEAEIREMLPFQLPKSLPYPLEDILYDFLIVAKSGGSSKALVFILQIKKIEQVLNILKNNKNLIVDITISSMGLYSWIRFQRPFLRKKLGENFILMDIDRNVAEFMVVDPTQLQFSRSFTFSGPSEFIQETGRTLMSLRREFPGLNIESAVFTGRTSLYDTVQHELRSLFEPYSILTVGSMENIPCSKKIKDLCANSDFSFSHLIGLSLKQDRLSVTFLPRFLKEKKKGLLRRKKVKDLATICVEAILILSLLFLNTYHRRRLYLNWLDERLQEFKLKTKKLDQVLEKIKVIEREGRQKKFFSEILSKMPTLVSEGVFLTSLEFDESDNFYMRGYAQNTSDVVDMTSSLNKSLFFENSEISYITRRKQRGNVLIEFRITGDLKKPK